MTTNTHLCQCGTTMPNRGQCPHCDFATPGEKHNERGDCFKCRTLTKSPGLGPRTGTR